MKEIINKIFKSSILGALSLVVLGILLIFESEATIVTISYVIGGILVAIGVLALLKFYKEVKDNDDNDTGMDLVYGIISIVLGIVVALILCRLNKEKFGVDFGFILENTILGILFGTLGARIYYVIFNLEY